MWETKTGQEEVLEAAVIALAAGGGITQVAVEDHTATQL